MARHHRVELAVAIGGAADVDGLGAPVSRSKMTQCGSCVGQNAVMHNMVSPTDMLGYSPHPEDQCRAPWMSEFGCGALALKGMRRLSVTMRSIARFCEI